MTDVLSDLLDALKLEGMLYFNTEFSPPWGVRVPALGRVARFHLVSRGRMWVRVAREKQVELLEPGDLVVVPHGAEHFLMDEPDRACLDVDRVVEESGFAGKGALIFGGEDAGNPTRLVCGHFALNANVDHPFMDSLPSRIVIGREEAAHQPHLMEIFEFVTQEARNESAGSYAIVRRLSEVLFIQALRVWAQRDGAAQGPLAALSDSHLGPGLTLIHSRFAEPWSLQDLARESGLSRTAFSVRFREVVGLPPMQYLAFWRMQRARQLLAESTFTLEAVAGEVGYQSAPAFHRVFKRWIGRAPGAYRKERQGR